MSPRWLQLEWENLQEDAMSAWVCIQTRVKLLVKRAPCTVAFDLRLKHPECKNHSHYAAAASRGLTDRHMAWSMCEYVFA